MFFNIFYFNNTFLQRKGVRKRKHNVYKSYYVNAKKKVMVLVRRYTNYKFITEISINLLVVYRESVNLIGYITRRLSADSQQL